MSMITRVKTSGFITHRMPNNRLLYIFDIIILEGVTFMQVKEGDIVTGRVSGLTDFGAFVDIGAGKTGMIHISEVSSSFVNNIEDFLSVGQEVKAVVVSVNEKGKISLSTKRVQVDGDENAQTGKTENNPATGKPPRPKSAPNVWNGPKQTQQSGGSFEDMMALFKKQSDEKMADLKRATNTGHSGYSRRGGNR